MQQWVHNRAQSLLDWLEAPRKGSLAAARRMLLTLGLVFLLGILPWHIEPGRARWWGPAAIIIIALIGLAGLGLGSFWGTRVLEAMKSGKDLRIGSRQLRVPQLGLERGLELVWQVVCRLGILLPALMFFLLWSLIYLSLWAWDPASCSADPALACAHSFGGIGDHPTFGDFLYYSVNMAFANPTPDIIGRSRLIHSLNTVEVMSGIGLASMYAGAFFGVGAQAKSRE